MQKSSSAAPSAKRIILKAWLVAGSLDILTACIYYTIRTGNSPLRVLKFVASGVFWNFSYQWWYGIRCMGHVAALPGGIPVYSFLFLSVPFRKMAGL